MTEKTQHYDIIIVGGGMVGATLACALGCSSFGQGLSIAVIEAKKNVFDWHPESHDIRVSAISHASQHILTNIGAWSLLPPASLAAYEKMQVWDATGQGQIHFDSIEVGQTDLGHIIENREIQKALHQRLADFENIDVLAPVKLQTIQLREQDVLLLTEDNQQLTCDLIVGADGANSWVREQAKIPLNTWSYHQSAVVCNVALSESHQNTCWQQFMPDGPLAFLPLSDGQCSIVWSTSEANAQKLVQMDEWAFNDAIQTAFGDNLGTITLKSERAAFPLRLRHAKQYALEHLVLVGDAAHTVHPLAGQGVNLGFLDAAVLAEEIIRAQQTKRAIGSLSTLRRYERRRKGDNLSMLAAMDGFKRLFSNNNQLLSLFRNAGLNIVEQLKPIKNIFIKQAMGLTGELPQIAKPKL